MKFKILFTILFFFLIFTCPALADSWAYDKLNFESYPVGNLSNNTNWGDYGSPSQVTNTTAYTGSQSARARYDGYSSAYYAPGSNLFDSYRTVSFAAKKHSVATGWTQRLEVRFYDYNLDHLAIINVAQGYVYLQIGTSLVAIGSYTPDTWFTVTAEFDPKNGKVRAKMNNGAFSDWRDFNVDPSRWNLYSLGWTNFENAWAYLDDFTFSDEVLPPFAITSPKQNAAVVDDSTITVEGVCPTNGANRIGLTSDCLGFDNIQYNIDCVDGKFSAPFYKSGSSNRIIAREKDSVSGDCVDYDALMDFIEVDGFQLIEGYPSDWNFNLDYYDDYDIKINSPAFDMPALTLPAGSTQSLFSFNLVYPSDRLNNLTFNIKQYDNNGNLLNPSYNSQSLSAMTDTHNYQVSLNVSSTSPLHYVVQLLDAGEVKRQYPFGVYVSDLTTTINPSNTYLFPRLAAELRKKAIFNYYFAFQDGFNSLFSAAGMATTTAGDALDITFNSTSGNGQYNLKVPIFSASDSRVKNFAEGLRPYITALLWLGFAAYVVFRITHLFSDNE